jgi:hypothetical protein
VLIFQIRLSTWPWQISPHAFVIQEYRPILPEPFDSWQKVYILLQQVMSLAQTRQHLCGNPYAAPSRNLSRFNLKETI